MRSCNMEKAAAPVCTCTNLSPMQHWCRTISRSSTFPSIWMNSSPLWEVSYIRAASVYLFPPSLLHLQRLPLRFLPLVLRSSSGEESEWKDASSKRWLCFGWPSSMAASLYWFVQIYFWSLFLECKFCLSYLLHSPKWTRGLFQPDPDFAISLLTVSSPSLTLSVWLLGHLFPLVASSLLAISLLIPTLSAFFYFLLFTFPFAFHPVWIPPLTDCVALFLDIFGSSGTVQHPLLSLCTWDVIPPRCILKFYDLRHTEWI